MPRYGRDHVEYRDEFVARMVGLCVSSAIASSRRTRVSFEPDRDYLFRTVAPRVNVARENDRTNALMGGRFFEGYAPTSR